MCPLAPFHIFFLYLCLILPLFFAFVEGLNDTLVFSPSSIPLMEESDKLEIQLTVGSDVKALILSSNHRSIASIDTIDGTSLSSYHQISSSSFFFNEKDDFQSIYLNLSHKNDSIFSLSFNISANFLGFAKILAQGLNESKETIGQEETLNVSVKRRKTIESKVFSYSVALLISLAYINMGCALDLGVVKETLRRPIGPLIGFISQFLFMPLLGYILGLSFSSIPLRLGLFVTGCSPGGGGSNIWTLILGGNLNLSLTMTAISTFSAFFMMPLWIWTLGSFILIDSQIVIPYTKILTYAICLVIPLTIGILISRYLPKCSTFLKRVLKPFAIFLILFILIFGIWANLYIFRLMDLHVWLAGLGLPSLGFTFGMIFALITRRSTEDVIAISIETGIQNTGVSIFILWFTLNQPLGDIAAVIPVAAATMTPLPLLLALLTIKIHSKITDKYGSHGPLSTKDVSESTEDEENSLSSSSSSSFVKSPSGF